MIRQAKKKDAGALCDIYNYYVKNTVITFEQEPVSLTEMQDRIALSHKDMPWLVFEDGGILGYAYVGCWKPRAAYGQSVEISIYLDPSAEGNGIGTMLYKYLFEEMVKTPIHCVLAGIALPNSSSIALHEKFGFEKVAHFTEVGRKFDQWVDVGYWQRLLPE